jgi:crossover junction endodeoxyribonuclease RuvC
MMSPMAAQRTIVAPLAALRGPGESIVVLGIDPGLQRTGYALLSDTQSPAECRLIEAGVIRLPRQWALANRLVELQNCLTTVLDTHRPALLACEELYAHYKHPRTAILMAHARGVIIALAASRQIDVLSVAATNVKKLLTGHGHASKRQMQLAVAATLRLPCLPEPADVADAIAIGLAGLRLRHAVRTQSAARKVRV